MTHKIEGFFRVCNARGLTGDQGVILPRDNMKNLMLKEEVVQSVSQGKFHLYAVSTIDEGIEVLTGVSAGALNEEGTVHYLVERRLEELAQRAREFGTSLARNQKNGSA